MADAPSIGTQAVRGAGWTIVTGVGSRGLGLVGTIVLTYFLARDVIGEVSDASIVVLLANQFSTIGIGNYLISKPNAGRDVVWHATAFHLALGVLAIGACVLLQRPLAVWMKAPTLGEYLPGLALSVMLDRIGFIPERLLARSMRFRRIGISRTVGELTYTSMSVGMAVLGFGGMAIVYANVMRSVLRMIVAVTAVDRAEWLTPSRYSPAILRAILRFGAPMSVGSSAELASRRLDNLLVSGLWGADVVGVYNLAYNVADVPAVQVGEQIGDVLLPSFAKMDHAQQKAALVRSTGLLALVVFPLAVGLGAIAPTVVHTLLKPTWYDVAPMLTILSALSVTRPVGWTINSYLQARDATRSIMMLEIVKLIAIVVAIVTLGRISPLWACGAVGVAFALHALASLWVVYRLDGIPLTRTIGKVMPPLLACLPMVAVILGARYALSAAGVETRGVGLIVELVAGGIGYVAGALVIARSTSRDFLTLVGNALRGRRSRART